MLKNKFGEFKFLVLALLFISPIRRINLALRWITQGASDKAFNKKKTIAQALADEIKMASEGNGESFSLRKKNESEKQADSAR